VTRSILRFDRVSLAFGDTVALDQVSFELREGETRIILGAAGSGKTVLLKTAIGLVPPDSGRISLFGEEITHMDEHRLFDIRAKVGMLFQESALFDSLTIEENVAYPLRNQRAVQCDADQVMPRVREALEGVELGHTFGKFPSELSGGMRRRVGIARANVTGPPLVFYDSPTAGLDPITATNIMSLVVKQRDLRNTTTVLVSHRLQDGALMANYQWNPEAGRIERLAHTAQLDLKTRFMVMQGGRVVFEGTEDELSRSRDPYVSKFVLK
jgi:phospholipid/cholesterol/gamma-HCH transport system ATP-binding protein